MRHFYADFIEDDYRVDKIEEQIIDEQLIDDVSEELSTDEKALTTVSKHDHVLDDDSNELTDD